jgi:hypothetical protein
MKHSALSLLALMLMAPAQAAETRPVTDAEFAALVVGCWSSPHGDLCFEEDGTVFSSVSTRPDQDGLWYGGSGGGTFDVSDGKLVLKSQTDFWALPLTDVACDAFIRPGSFLDLSCAEIDASTSPQNASVRLHAVVARPRS